MSSCSIDSATATSTAVSAAQPHEPWMTRVLLAAALYNVAFGALAIFFPDALFNWVGAQPPLYSELWQCVGMIVGVYGVGYGLAAIDAYRYWPVVLVGLLGKIFGPIGFVYALIKGTFPLGFGWVILTNDLIWWVPFFLILLRKYQHFQAEARAEIDRLKAHRDKILPEIETNTGERLLDISRQEPLLLVFLRHTGCTFCREMVAELSEALPTLKEQGLRPVLIHMETPDKGQAFLEGFGLGQLAHVSDPSRQLYRTLGLGRGSWGQLFGLKTVARGFEASRFGVGTLSGDGFQLSGYAVLADGEICVIHAHQYAGEKTPFEPLAKHYGLHNTEGLRCPA